MFKVHYHLDFGLLKAIIIKVLPLPHIIYMHHVYVIAMPHMCMKSIFKRWQDKLTCNHINRNGGNLTLERTKLIENLRNSEFLISQQLLKNYIFLSDLIKCVLIIIRSEKKIKRFASSQTLKMFLVSFFKQ